MTIMPLLAIVALLGVVAYASTQVLKSASSASWRKGTRAGRLTVTGVPLVVGLLAGLVVEFCGGLSGLLLALGGAGTVGLSAAALLGLVGGALATQTYRLLRAWMGHAASEPLTRVAPPALDVDVYGEPVHDESK